MRRWWWVTLLTASCSSSGGDTGSAGDVDVAPGFDRNALLRSVADNVIVPNVGAFAQAATELETAVAAWAAEPGDATRRQDARDRWLDASLVWQRSEVLQVGPTGDAGVRTGGQSFRDEIYSWTLTNPCGVDQELVANQFDDPSYLDGRQVNVYGLDALEYLLYAESDANRCAPQAQINRDGRWDDLVRSGRLPERRAGYAAAVAARLRATADAHRSAWEAFRSDFVGAGSSGSAYGSAQQAIDELFAALFYVDLQVKDDKLGTPAGLSAKCLQDRCLDIAESEFADAGRGFVRQNLLGFERAFFGGDRTDAAATGFDDYLTAAGASDLSQSMVDLLDAALAESETLDPPLRASLAQDRSSDAFTGVVELHEAVRQLAALLQSQFVSVLALEIPNEGAGDND
jgi:predicted lipoprotein